MDRISSLPDGVITHILSFLPIKEAALTSVLAKRWRILFAFSPNLHSLGYRGDKLKSFVDRVLSVSGHSPIKKFSLICNQGVEPAHINRWLCDVFNRGVEDFDLAVDGYEIYGYSLPSEIFTCKTLVKLKLSGISVYELPENAFLPALQTLSLDNVVFHNLEACAFAKLLSACPVLQDLSLTGLNWEHWKWCRSVSSRSLQRLTIKRDEFGGFYEPDFGNITFDTPNLTYLYYSDFIPDSYPVVNLDSLVEVNLDLVVTVNHTWDLTLEDENDNITSNATNLIKGLRNVEIMNVLSQESLEMFYFFREAISVFVNLLHLSIQPFSGCTWRGLPFLLNSSPNLKTLIINGPLNADESRFGSSGYSCLLSCPVKVLKITEYSGNSGDVEQLKHFLGKLSCLELLEVKISGTSDKKFQIATDLLMLPRASSKCKIQIIDVSLHESDFSDSE